VDGGLNVLGNGSLYHVIMIVSFELMSRYHRVTYFMSTERKKRCGKGKKEKERKFRRKETVFFSKSDFGGRRKLSG
jgi:hypothetical protein